MASGIIKDIVITRIFKVPVHAVWAAWTQPDRITQWWGPEKFKSPGAVVDLTEGGGFIFCMRAPEEMGGRDMYTAGTYTKIIPNERIEFTQWLSDEKGNKIDPTIMGMPADFPAEIPAALIFKPLDDNTTELTAIEYNWPLGQQRTFSEMGLNQCLDKMASMFAKEGAAA